MKELLTERQTEAYEYVRSYLQSYHKPPTLREIGDALGIRSTNGVYKLLRALEAKGYIEREKHKARSLELVDDEPDDPFATEGGMPPLLIASRSTSEDPASLRRGAAGFLSVDPRLLRKAQDIDACLVVRAGDDGMSREGIRKQDLLVVEERPWTKIARHALVAALLGTDVRVRRFAYHGGRIELHPNAKNYTKDSFVPDDPDCHVVGPVQALVRTF